MNKILHTAKQAILYIRREYWSAIAEYYSMCITRSRHVSVGSYSLIVETYCEAILDKCKSLAIDIPAPTSQKPRRLERLFMTWRFGLPSWPIRISLYKGQRLEQVEASPNEIAEVLQKMYDASIRQAKQNRSSASKFEREVEPTPAIKEPQKNNTDIMPGKRARLTIPRQNKTIPTSDDSKREDNPGLYRKVEGAIFDLSF